MTERRELEVGARREIAVSLLKEAMRIRALEEWCGVEIHSSSVLSVVEGRDGDKDFYRRFTETSVRGRILREISQSVEFVEPDELQRGDQAKPYLIMTMRMLVECDEGDEELGLEAGVIPSGDPLSGGNGAIELWVRPSSDSFVTILLQEPDGTVFDLEPCSGGIEMRANTSDKIVLQLLGADADTLAAAVDDPVEMIRLVATRARLMMVYESAADSSAADCRPREVEAENLAIQLARLPLGERAETLLTFVASPRRGGS